MYRLFSPQEIINNVVVLALPYISDIEQLDLMKLKQAYQDYLSKLQPHCPYIKGTQLFYADDAVETAFTPYFTHKEVELELTEDKIIPLDKVLYPNAKMRQSALEKSFSKMELRDSTFTDLFKLIMNTVFCTTTQRRGGTSVNPKYIGVMCAYHDMNAEEQTIPELFIHEFTHHALFLDELCHGHYNYSVMKQADAQADIFFNGKEYKISFHRCLHSLFVNAEVLLARDEFIGHDLKISQHLTSDKIIERGNIYIKATKMNPYFHQIITPRSKMLFERCEQFYSARV